MSHTESSSPLPSSPCVGVSDDSADKNTELVSNESINSDTSVRQRVLQEVGFTSTTFIGPAFPPQTNTAKPDIEDTLSEFYKELEKIDGADDDPGKPGTPTLPKISTSKQSQDVRVEEKSAETDGHQKSSGQKQPSWPHWHHNEPYQPRRPRPGLDHSSGRAPPPHNQWRHPHALNGPPNPNLHRPPPYHPPPTAFQHPQDPPSHMNQHWSSSGVQNQYQEELHFPKFDSFPPPNVCSLPSQGFYGDSPQHFERDEQSCIYDARFTESENVGWSRERNEEWYHADKDYRQHQRYDSQNEVWERRCTPPVNNTHHSSFVLILMRGLPGSGKSTLAKELLSTGPSGLILSTDDYFDHREGYRYDPGLLGAAHEWNQSRAKDAMHDGRSPIIIDNTNIQAWEMKPYVRMALEAGYKVDFCEPDTRWKFDPYELEKRNKHGVSQEKIAQMMDRFSSPISIDIVMSSHEPPHVTQRHRPMRKNHDFY